MLSNQLTKLVKSIPNLRENLTSERVQKYQMRQGPFRLSYATELVTDDILSALFDFAKEKKVINWMHRMQQGEVINCFNHYVGENRRVLHTALRISNMDLKLPLAVQEIAKQALHELDQLEQFLGQLQDFHTIVQVGIGGSLLGPQAVYEALKYQGIPGKSAYFICNVDPDHAAFIFNQIDLSKTLFVIVSKSGTTLETLANEKMIRQRLLDLGLNPKDHLVAVTEKNSLMDQACDYRKVFYMWDSIGGRFSVTSMVGAVLLAFTLGFHTFLQFLEGAAVMDQMALTADESNNLPLLGALLGVWNHCFLHYPTTAIIPYSEALSRFPAHIQQLSMESNGKQTDRDLIAVTYPTAPVVWGESGTNSQHSFFQLLHQGDRLASIEFIGFQESQYQQDLVTENSTSQEKLKANMLAQMMSLALGKQSQNKNTQFSGNRPSHLLTAKVCDPFTMGALVAYYEHKIAFQGFLWNINSFDQEGVQLGKKLSLEMTEAVVLKRQKKEVKNPLFKAFIDVLDFM